MERWNSIRRSIALSRSLRGSFGSWHRVLTARHRIDGTVDVRQDVQKSSLLDRSGFPSIRDVDVVRPFRAGVDLKSPKGF